MTYQPLDFRFLARCPPEEGAPHADLCLRALERAIDAAADADLAEGETAIRCWERAAMAGQEAQYRALAAAAALHRAQREAYERQGLQQCSSCHRWRPAAALERHATRLTETGEQAPRANTWLTCRDGCEP